MTVSRCLLLIVCTLSPAWAWGQGPSRPNLGADPRIVSQYPLEPGRTMTPGQPNRPQPGFIEDRGAVLSPGFSFGAGPQAQSAGGGQPEIPPGLMPRVARHYSSPIWQATQRGGYFGMMGAIAQPGVYFHSQERVPLGEMLKQAGGSTADASGAVRIVRQGRGGLQTFLSPDSKYELLNGDVVLLESHRRASQPGLRQFSANLQTSPNGTQRSSTTEASANKGGGTSYLAFVNLKAEPIIVPVPADEATLLSVMTWLRQDLKTPPFARVISPSPLVRHDASLPPEQQLLENGSVLVFDPTTVNHNRLPQFPAVIGATAAKTEEPARKAEEPTPAEKAPSASPRPIPELQLPSLQNERPASRATRPLPTRTPPPPTDSPAQPTVRRESAQSQVQERGGSHSWRSGPALLMPQNNSTRRPQPPASELGSRQAAPSQELNGEAGRQPEATAASFEGQPLSWQSGQPDHAAEVLGQEFENPGVVQAHGEQHHLNAEVEAGPVLELPRPIPNLQVEPATIPPESNLTEATAIKSLPENFSLQIVWFSIGGMVLLVGILWCLSRWDGPRPVHARVTTRGVLGTDRNRPALKRGASVQLSERQPTRRTDVGTTMNDLSSNPPSASSTPQPPAAPLPVRAISPQEHALRAHFRQAWLERGQRQTPVEEAAQTEAPKAATPARTQAPAVVPSPHTSRAPTVAKTADVLDRALLAKRGQITSE